MSVGSSLAPDLWEEEFLGNFNLEVVDFVLDKKWFACVHVEYYGAVRYGAHDRSVTVL
jgi:hypothetical protein